MSVKRTVSKPPSKDQKTSLITFLEENPELARNQFQTLYDGKRTMEELWDEIAGTVNSLGCVEKSGTSWKKYWEDLSRRTKAKYIKLKADLNKSGVNGTNPISDLDDLEKRIISIISIDSVEGDGETYELGTVYQIIVPEEMEMENHDPENEIISRSSKTKRTLKQTDDKQWMNEVLQLKKQKLNVLKLILTENKIANNLKRKELELKYGIQLSDSAEPHPNNESGIINIEILDSD